MVAGAWPWWNSGGVEEKMLKSGSLRNKSSGTGIEPPFADSGVAPASVGHQGNSFALDLISQYTAKIRKIPRKLPDGTFWRKSRAFAATDETNPPLSLPRMMFKSTHKTTSRNATSTINQPIFVTCPTTVIYAPRV